MKGACKRATGQEVEHIGLLVHELSQHAGYLVAKRLRHTKLWRSNDRDPRQAQLPRERDLGAVLSDHGALLHGEAAQDGVFLENRRDSRREIGSNAFTLRILRPVVVVAAAR